MTKKLNDFIDRVENLPPSPRLLVKLLDLFEQPDQDLDEVVKLVSQDPAFTVEILKRCNSAYFGGNPAEDVFQAVSRLGVEQLYKIVLALFATTGIMRPGRNSHVEILWTHSLAVAVAAGVLARETGESTPAAFTAGLLHEVGKVIMVSANEAAYAQAVQNAGIFKRAQVVTEQEIFGFDHTEVGACLLIRWNLPSNIVTAVLHHHQLSGAEPHERLASIVHLSNLIAHGTSEKFASAPKGLEAATDSLAALKFTSAKVSELMPAMRKDLDKAKVLNPA